MNRSLISNRIFIIGLISLIIVGVAAYFAGNRYHLLSEDNKANQVTILELEEKVQNYENDIAKREAEKNDLTNSLLAKQDEVNSISEQFEDVVDTVNTLEKLSKTDKELLQKYSKVYFLNEHYIPSNLSDIDEKYLSDKNQKMQIHSKVSRFLKNMIEEAEDDGIDLRIISAYRSFSMQNSLKSSYTVHYGAGANTFSADQGYSEHQLGTTVDFTTAKLGASFSYFEPTDAYKWLQNNAHKFGFVLSYPKGNRFYVFEPWHWRFVGVRLAKNLNRTGTSFYDLDQREIDKYLVNIFD